jgi:hypothetical protein
MVGQFRRVLSGELPGAFLEAGEVIGGDGVGFGASSSPSPTSLSPNSEVESAFHRRREFPRSADWQPAVSRIGNPPGRPCPGASGEFPAADSCIGPADYQSAIQQVANLRYASGSLAASELGLNFLWELPNSFCASRICPGVFSKLEFPAVDAGISFRARSRQGVALSWPWRRGSSTLQLGQADCRGRSLTCPAHHRRYRAVGSDARQSSPNR